MFYKYNSNYLSTTNFDVLFRKNKQWRIEFTPERRRCLHLSTPFAPLHLQLNETKKDVWTCTHAVTQLRVKVAWNILLMLPSSACCHTYLICLWHWVILTWSFLVLCVYSSNIRRQQGVVILHKQELSGAFIQPSTACLRMVFIRKKALGGTPKCVITLSPCGCCLQVLSHKKIEEFGFRMWKLSSVSHWAMRFCRRRTQTLHEGWAEAGPSLPSLQTKNSSKCDNTQRVWLKLKSSEQNSCEMQCKPTDRFTANHGFFTPELLKNNTAAWPSTPTLPFLHKDWFGTMSLGRKWAVSSC